MERFNRSRRIFSPIFFASIEASAVASSTVSFAGLMSSVLTIVLQATRMNSNVASGRGAMDLVMETSPPSDAY
jgi:hypothetical protein